MCRYVAMCLKNITLILGEKCPKSAFILRGPLMVSKSY